MVTPTSPTAVLGILVAGVMLLIYGVRMVTDTIQRAADARVRHALIKISRYPAATFGIGVVATGLTQSSSAMSTLLVGLVGSDLVPLTAAMMMLLGSNVGSTLVVQLLALHITDFAIELVGLGAAVAIFTRKGSKSRLGQGFFAFTLIILGLAALEHGSAAIASSPVTATLLTALIEAPFVLALIGAVMAMALTSSAATIGLVLVLAGRGVLPPQAALALTLGANVGTTLMALLSALGGDSIVGRRLAFFHTGTKLVGAIIVFIFMNPLIQLLSQIWPDAGTQVAMTHLGFNLALAIVYAPFCNLISKLILRILPDPKVEGEQSLVRYLDLDAVGTPAVALGLATREILRMADTVTEMHNRCMQAFEEYNDNLAKTMNGLDTKLDKLETVIKNYLTQLDKTKMSEEQIQRCLGLLYIITDLEAIGDIVDQQMMRIARRRQRNQIIFSEEGWLDLMTYHREVAEALQQVLTALAAQDTSIVAEFLEHKSHLHQIKRSMQQRHLQRLQSGVSPSINSSSIHLDLLNAQSQVLIHASNMAYAIMGTK